MYDHAMPCIECTFPVACHMQSSVQDIRFEDDASIKVTIESVDYRVSGLSISNAGRCC